jgi:hypothetical protein
MTLMSAGMALLMMGTDVQSASHLSSSTTNSISSNVTSSITSTATTTFNGKPGGGIKSKVIVTPATGVTSSVTSSMTVTHAGKVTAIQIVLSSRAEALARTLKFDRKVLMIVKEETHENIRRLIGYDENDYQIIAPGISVSVPKEKTDSVLAALRKRLLPLHYLPFVVEKKSGFKIDEIGVIKGTDQYEILRIMHTDGEEDDISNQDVIDRLKEWEKIASFDIIGAGSYWVELEFKTLPKDLKSFAEEVNDFSPGVTEQVPRTSKELIREIKKTNKLLLLWD